MSEESAVHWTIGKSIGGCQTYASEDSLKYTRLDYLKGLLSKTDDMEFCERVVKRISVDNSVKCDLTWLMEFRAYVAAEIAILEEADRELS